MEAKIKICPKCGRTLSVAKFGNDKSSPDGKKRWCKECLNAQVRSRYYKKRERPTLNPDLEGFTPQMLITELRARGYKGELSYEETKIYKIQL